MSELPSSWVLAPLGDLLADIVGGGTPDKSKPEYFQGDIPFMTVKDMHTRFVKDTQDHITPDALRSSASRLVPADTLVVASRMSLGKIARPQVAVAINQDLKALFLHDGVDKSYIEYAWRANAARIQRMGAGTTVKGIRLGDIRQLEIALAPSAEQTRIAVHLDKLLAPVQSCNDRLDTIPALLKLMRRAVVRAAVSGNLTADARQANGWPNQWSIAKLSSLGELGRGKSTHRPRNDSRLYGGPYPFIQTGDVAQSGGRITKHERTYTEFGLSQSKLWPAGTLCITIAGNIADTAILTYPACFPDSVVGFVANPEKCLPEFVKWSIESIKEDLESLAPGTAQKNINLVVLNNLTLRYPPLKEQELIVERATALLDFANRIQKQHRAAKGHSARITEMLFSKAFRGDLVSQDPNDEPAAGLLARLAAEHNNAPASPPPRKPRAPRAPKETYAMTKSRHDEDVMGKPYLAQLLRKLAVPTSAQMLFKEAKLPLAEFYKQLAWEVAQGYVKDQETLLEPGDAA